jgi:hypothetical protein
MKKAILLLTLSMGLTFASYANNSTNPVKPVTKKETAFKQNATAPQAFHCIIYDKDGQKVAECWLRNCENLYKAVHGSKPKETVG